jgi:serine/threonine-protein kinase HipA
LLQAEFPGPTVAGLGGLPSYPGLAGQLGLIGAPVEDRIELFDRMVFNAVCGNDDDHLRNHAACYEYKTGVWRLSPAFDVVPNPDSTPTHLALAINRSDKHISKNTILQDSKMFGFESSEAAQLHLNHLLERIRAGFDATQDLLDKPLRTMMRKRMLDNLKILL